MIARGCHGRDSIVPVVAFTTACAISAYHHYSCEFESRSWRGVLDTTLYVIKFVSDLWQVSGFLWIFRFPLHVPIKLTATIRPRH